MSAPMFEGGSLHIPVHTLLEVHRSLSSASFEALLLSLPRLSAVAVPGGFAWGWDPFHQQALQSWGLGVAASRKAVSELCAFGFAERMKHSRTGRQYAAAGPVLLTWLPKQLPAGVQQAAVQKVDNRGGDLSLTGHSPATSTSSSSSLTTSDPALELFDALSSAAPEARRKVLEELFSVAGSADKWQPWVQCSSLGPSLGAVSGFCDVVEQLVTDPGSSRQWCKDHGVRLAQGAIGVSLASRVVFALVSATGMQVRSEPAGWIAHLAKPSTSVTPSAAASRVVSALRSFQRRQTAEVSHPTVTNLGAQDAEVLQLPSTPQVLDPDVWAELCERIPSLAVRTVSDESAPQAADAQKWSAYGT